MGDPHNVTGQNYTRKVVCRTKFHEDKTTPDKMPLFIARESR